MLNHYIAINNENCKESKEVKKLLWAFIYGIKMLAQMGLFENHKNDIYTQFIGREYTKKHSKSFKCETALWYISSQSDMFLHKCYRNTL